MKKTIIVLALALIVVYAALALVSSSEEYAAEKLFYHALKTSRTILVNPDVAPPVMLTNVEKDLNKILTKYPKTAQARIAHLTLAEFYIDTKRYDKALSIIDEIKNKYKDNIMIVSRAQFLKGFVYEAQNKWETALREYTILRDKYTNTPAGLRVPLYIGMYYAKKGMQAEADNAYNMAISFYKRLEAKNRGELLGYTASNLLIQACVNLKKYEQAGKVMEDIINNYPTALVLQQHLPSIEFIFIKMLNRPEKAIEIFNNIKKNVQDPKIKEFLEKKINEIKGKKS